jgi:hypothetical protein
MEVYGHRSLAEVEGYEQAVRDLSLAEADRQHRDSPKNRNRAHATAGRVWVFTSELPKASIVIALVKRVRILLHDHDSNLRLIV